MPSAKEILGFQPIAFANLSLFKMNAQYLLLVLGHIEFLVDDLNVEQ